MKKHLLLPVIASTMFLLSSCENKTVKVSETASEQITDAETAKKEVVALMDNLHNSLKNKKPQDFKNLLDINGLYCGTDPTEIYNRENYASQMEATLSDPNLGTVAYTVDTREVRVDENGEAATILEQYKVDLFSPEIPWRLVTHAIKKDGSWKIDFMSFSLVPTNQQQDRINDALQTKE
jgi:hypothetical protein